MEPVRLPLAVGVKVTLIVQPEPAATLVPQLLVCAKSPLATMLVKAMAAVPVLLRVIGCEAEVELTSWPGNVKLAGERLAAGAVPVPLRVIVWGLLGELSVIVIDPVRLPPPVGVKVTLIVQPEPAATLDPQVLVCAKSPLATMLVKVIGAVPVLLRVTACAVEVELTS